MSSDDDSRNFEIFIADQKKKVKKRYMSKQELENLDTMDHFIADSDSDSDDESVEESEKSEISDEESVAVESTANVEDTKKRKAFNVKNESSDSLFSDLSESDSIGKSEEIKLSNRNSRKRRILNDSECSLDNIDIKKKSINNFAYRSTKETENFSPFIDNNFLKKLHDCRQISIQDKLPNIQTKVDYKDYADYKNIQIEEFIEDTPLNVNVQRFDFISSLLSDVDESVKDCEAASYVRCYRDYKEKLSLKIYQICNMKIFLNKLPPDTDIKWCPGLQKTAGRCILSNDNENPLIHTMEIQLSTKLLTNAERLLITLVHEMCHGAVWLIDRVNDCHGPLWLAWAMEVNRIFPFLSVSAKFHSYKIQFDPKWTDDSGAEKRQLQCSDSSNEVH